MLHPALHVRETEGKGRGMFTKKFIPAEKVIEISPVVVMTAQERLLLDQTKLHDYIFEWQDGCCMALGFVPVYNHAYNSNCEYLMDYDENTIQIKTVRNIEPGEELTINYNGDWNDEKKVWFDVKG